MPDPSEIVVVHRNLRWEVSIDGITRPLIDWFSSKERAVEHALENARAVGARRIVIEAWDGTIEAIASTESGEVRRISQVA